MIRRTTAYKRIKQLQKKIRVIQGGQSASKTYSILTLIFEEALQNPIKATVVTETYPQLRDGVIADFRNIIKDAGLNWEYHYNKGDKNLNLWGSEIQFRNVDNNDFHKSKGVRRDILFVNEGNRTYWESVDQLLTRSKVTYIDYNPDREFWVHEHLLKRPDCDFLILTYKDNECISPEEKKEIEMRRNNEQWWRIYGEGQLGVYSDRQIYKYEFCDEIPATAKRLPSGMDFGLSPDPTILIDIYVEGTRLFVDEVFCENNLMPEKIKGAERQSIVDKMQEVSFPKGWLIVADSAGRNEIRDLQKYGYNVKGVSKPKNAMIEGIGKIRGYDLFLTKRSVNMKKGIESWFFKIDANGKIVPEPDGHEPDGLAALRYSLSTKIISVSW